MHLEHVVSLESPAPNTVTLTPGSQKPLKAPWINVVAECGCASVRALYAASRTGRDHPITQGRIQKLPVYLHVGFIIFGAPSTRSIK